MGTTSTRFVILDRSKLRRPWELLVERHTTGRSGAEVLIFRNEVHDEDVLCRSSCTNSNISSNRSWKSSLEFAGVLHEIMKLRFLNTGTQRFVKRGISVWFHVQFCRWKALTISHCTVVENHNIPLSPRSMDVYWSLIFQCPIYLELSSRFLNISGNDRPRWFANKAISL